MKTGLLLQLVELAAPGAGTLGAMTYLERHGWLRAGAAAEERQIRDAALRVLGRELQAAGLKSLPPPPPNRSDD